MNFPLKVSSGQYSISITIYFEYDLLRNNFLVYFKKFKHLHIIFGVIFIKLDLFSKVCRISFSVCQHLL